MSEIVCPSGFAGRIKHYTVREEALFADRKLVRSGGVQEKILQACWEKTLSPGPYAFSDPPRWDDVLVGDAAYALIQVRIETHGPDYQFRIQCSNPGCRARIEWEEDLSKFPVRKLEGELLEAYKNGNECEVFLPKAGKKVTFRLPTGRDQKHVIKMRAFHKDELSALSLFLRVTRVEGLHQNSIFDFLSDLSGSDADLLRDEFDRLDFGVETAIQVECQECGNEMDLDLPLEDTFFSPAKGRRARQKRVLVERTTSEEPPATS